MIAGAGGSQATKGASGYSTHVLVGTLLQHTLGCACPGGQAGTLPATAERLTGCDAGSVTGVTGGGSIALAREKHSLAPPSPVRQHTSNCPPGGTCHPSGHAPSLQIAGPPCEEMMAEQTTGVIVVGFDPVSENMP